jgi:hypothetical protein
MQKISEIIPTQCEIRDWNVFESMLQFLYEGNIFSQDKLCGNHKGLIIIAKFEDGCKYFRDGHTRSLAIFATGRHEIHEEEYKVEKYTYSQWEEINTKAGWVTPFDPKTEIRIADFWNYKNSVPNDELTAMKAICFARRKGVYSHCRSNVLHIRDLFKRCPICCQDGKTND